MNSPQKKTIATILGVMLASFVVIIFLAWIENSRTPKKNGFIRTFYKEKATFLYAFHHNDVTGIAGATKLNFYFQTKVPGKLLVTDRVLNNPHHIYLDVSPDPKISSRFDCIVDSPLVYTFAGNASCIIVSDMNKKTTSNYVLPGNIFTRCIPISNSSFVLRSTDSSIKTADQIFFRKNFYDSSSLREKNIINKKGDLGLSSDGLLRYDSTSHLLYYIYFYSNGFICLDTNLQVQYRASTIDTIDNNKMKVGGVSSGNSEVYTNLSPKFVVNYNSEVANGKLYINGMLSADNETGNDFSNNSAIDVYDLKSKKYYATFYIPHFKKEAMKKFKVFGNTLIAFYKDYIAAYQIN